MRVPLLIHYPTSRHPDLHNSTLKRSLKFTNNTKRNTNPLKKYNKPVELLDLMPTIVDLAGLPSIPLCLNSKVMQTCTEGKSLKHLFQKNSEVNRYNKYYEGNASSRHNYAFSQYPRPSTNPRFDSDQPRYKEIRYMGYSIRSKRYRYTQWVKLHIGKQGNQNRFFSLPNCSLLIY